MPNLGAARADSSTAVSLQLEDAVCHDYITLAEDLSDFRTVDPHTEKDYVSLLAHQKGLNFPPGTQFSYRNSNYFLLGIVVKRVTGMTLRQFADRQIFGPLGMRHTHFEDDHTEDVRNRATGYDPSGHGFSAVRSSFDQVGDGGLLTTLNDLALWDQEYYENKLGGSDLGRLLLTTGELRDGTKLDYAFGLFVDPSPHGLEVFHGGWLPRFQHATRAVSGAPHIRHLPLQSEQYSSRTTGCEYCRYLPGRRFR